MLIIKKISINALLAVFLLTSATSFAEKPKLFDQTPARPAQLPAYAKAAKVININRRALNSKTIELEVFGESLNAVRVRLENHKAGQKTWVGHLQGTPTDTVIITLKGQTVSGLIQYGNRLFQIGLTQSDGNFTLFELDNTKLPADEAENLPQGGADFSSLEAVQTLENNVQQDLLVVYTQAACNTAGSCSQIEADINTAVSDMNTAYSESGVNITMNLVGAVFIDYNDANKSGSAILGELSQKNDGNLDEVHTLRDQLGADIVSLIYNNTQGFCGFGYVGATQISAFSVTKFTCLLGNRTMAHEIGHNQGAVHDRKTQNATTSTAYNFGYRRCADGSDEDLGSPYFRTVMSYSCSSAPRVGRFSNPNVEYLRVPQGIDPAIEPLKGAWTARTLNESASFIAGFRTAPLLVPPTAPSNLMAIANGTRSVSLTWSDNSLNESSFNLQSSTDGINWVTTAQLASNTNSYEDTDLNPDATYFYRINAQNSAGASDFSNISSASTEALPETIVDRASLDTAITGTVNGSYLNTHFDDGNIQVITEVSSGGAKRSRKQSLTHQWQFNVSGGIGGVLLSANAWVSGQEGVDFFYSSDNGSTWNLMFTINDTNSASNKIYALPDTSSGIILVEARDVDQVSGESADTLSVDYLIITSSTVLGNPPATPSELNAIALSSTSVEVRFKDNATDEFGFEIWRANSDPLTDCNAGKLLETIGASAATGTVSYTDISVMPETTYWYWANAYNSVGDNGLCSNVDSVITPVGSPASLTASGFKVKGKQNVDLTWAGLMGSQVDIYRNNNVIASTVNDGSYTDNIGAKGFATYNYKVCTTGSISGCSETVQVVF